MSRSTADHCANFGDSLPHSRPVPPIRSCSLCFSRSSLPCLGRPMRAQSRPPRHLRARATSRRRKRAANPPRAPTRSTLSAGVRPCGRRRERGGATVGVYVRFSQVWSAAAIIAGVMPSSSAAAAAARWQRWQQRRQPWGLSRRRDPARVGASQCYACRQRAAAGREARRPEQSAEKASACAAVVQVQCARVRAFLLM